MASLSIFQFIRGRKKACRYWRERCQRKDTELGVAAEKAYIRGTEESRQGYLSKLRGAKRDYIIDIEQRSLDAEDLKILKEQNSQWLCEAERKLAKVQEKIDRLQRRRVVGGHGNHRHAVIEVRM